MTDHPVEDLPYEDPEPPVSPEVRTAKAVLFLLAFVPLSILVVVLLLFFQPDHQVLIKRYDNGYPATRTEYVVGPADQPVKEGRHEAWYENGKRAEEGRHAEGLRTGTWRFWDEEERLDPDRSGVYEAGVRVAPLPD